MTSNDMNPYRQPSSEPTPIADTEEIKLKNPLTSFVSVVCLFIAVTLTVILSISELCNAGTWPTGMKLYITVGLIVIFALFHIVTIPTLLRTDIASIRSSPPNASETLCVLVSMIGGAYFLIWYFGEFMDRRF